MERLSNDTCFLLVLQLELPDIFNLVATCKTFSKLTKNDLLFRAIFYRDFGQHLKPYTIADLREWCSPFNELHEGPSVRSDVVKMIEETTPQEEELAHFRDLQCLPAGWTWRRIYEKFYRTQASILWIMREQAVLHPAISTTSTTKTWHLPPKDWTTRVQMVTYANEGEKGRDDALIFNPIYLTPDEKGCVYPDFEEDLHELDFARPSLQLINQALVVRAQQQLCGTKENSNIFEEEAIDEILRADMICVKEGIVCKTMTADSVIQYELTYHIHGMCHFLSSLRRNVQAEYQQQRKVANEFLKQTLMVEHCLTLPRGSTLANETLDQLQSYLLSYFRRCDLEATLLGTSLDQTSNKLLICHQCIRKPHWMLRSDQCSFSNVEKDNKMGTLTRAFCTSTAGVTADYHLCNYHAEQTAPADMAVDWKIHMHEVFREQLAYPLAPHLKLKSDLTFMLKDFADGREIPVLLHCTQVKVSN